MRIIPRKLLFVPMLCVLSVFLLSFIFRLPSSATGAGQTFFVQCEEKYKFCQDIGNFLVRITVTVTELIAFFSILL